jgi:RimJ/RimL family protein N-acetyltransferase
MPDTIPVRLRRAVADDIGFIMATERLPGYEWLVGRWDAARHAATLAEPSSATLVAEDAAGVAQGFAILRQIDDPDGNVFLQRIAVAFPGNGFGRPMLCQVTDWVFGETAAHRLWLLMKQGNDRADHVYRTSGFSQEGVLRQSQIGPDGSRVDALMFSKLRAEWSSTTRSATT